MIEAEDVVAIVTLLDGAGVAVWLDGGWGVDALVGKQSRPHDDVDLLISIDDTERAVTLLASAGYSLIEEEPPARLVLGDARGRRIDFHSVSFDADGGGVQMMAGGRSYRYPPHGFSGRGVVAGTILPCMTVDVQMDCHSGYEPDDTDRHDMRLLATTFGVRLPPRYRTD